MKSKLSRISYNIAYPTTCLDQISVSLNTLEDFKGLFFFLNSTKHLIVTKSHTRSNHQIK